MLFGITARATSPLMVNWFTSVVITIISFIFLIYHREVKDITRDLANHPGIIICVAAFDNLAWITYTYALVYLPIAIATGISECYIVLTIVLGLMFNKEKIKKHQWAGLMLAVVGVIVLSFLD